MFCLGVEGELKPLIEFFGGIDVVTCPVGDPSPVHGELIFKLQREAGIAPDSESASGSYSMWFAVWDCHRLH